MKKALLLGVLILALGILAGIFLQDKPKLCGPLSINDGKKAAAEILACDLKGCPFHEVYLDKLKSAYKEGDEVFYYSTYQRGKIGGRDGYLLMRNGQTIVTDDTYRCSID